MRSLTYAIDLALMPVVGRSCRRQLWAVGGGGGPGKRPSCPDPHGGGVCSQPGLTQPPGHHAVQSPPRRAAAATPISSSESSHSSRRQHPPPAKERQGKKGGGREKEHPRTLNRCEREGVRGGNQGRWRNAPPTEVERKRVGCTPQALT